MKGIMRTLAVVAAVVFATSALAVGPNARSGAITQVNAVVTGPGTSSDTVGMSVNQPIGTAYIFTGSDAKYQSVGVQVSGTFSATLTFQYSQDEGTTWVNAQAYANNLTTTPVATTTVAGNWIIPTAGWTNVRVTCTAFTSGTANVIMTGYIGAMPSLGPANSQRATYTASTTVTVPTAASSMAAVEAGAAKAVRLHALRICLTSGLQTTAGERQLVLFRTTAASSGGSAQTPAALDSTDAAFSGVARFGALTTTPAVGSVTQALALDSFVIFMPAAATTAVPCVYRTYDDVHGKAPTVQPGTANGLGLADMTGGTGGTGSYVVTAEFVEEAQ